MCKWCGSDFKTLCDWYGEGDLNPHVLYELWILSPVRLPIPPSPHGHRSLFGHSAGHTIIIAPELQDRHLDH